MNMKHIFNFTLLLVLLFLSHLNAQVIISKTVADDNSKFTNVGNIRITVTNFGTFGHGFALWPEQPSCEFPAGSGIEHIFDGGLYIGGYIADTEAGDNRKGPFVTTAAVDASSVSSRGGGFEFTNTAASFVKERSSLLTSKFYDPTAISHQDLISDFSDTSTTYLNGEVIENHDPLGVAVHQENYAWNYPFADFFVIFNYWIKNVSDKYINDMYVGLWSDTVVRNTKVTSPGGSSFFNKGGNGYNDSLKIAYEFDAKGDVGFTDSYIGVQLLGANEQYDSVNFVSWQYKNTDDPVYFAPQEDNERFTKLEGYFGGELRYNETIANALKQASNRSILISAGKFEPLAPGDSINVTFAILGAKKYGDELAELDTEEQKTNLYNNADWALRAYHGEDRNRDGILDPDEDIDGNDEITRYILPTPPVSPRTRVEIESNKAIIYWDNAAENSVDPISGDKDFEGYRIYRTNAGFDLTEAQDILGSLVTLAEFDSANNNIFFDTGFNAVSLTTPKTFPDDSVTYHYKFEVDNLLNGWQYLFAVTAFDKGDKANKIESLESSSIYNINRVLPGTPPVDDADTEIGVYPNPYYAHAYWDGESPRLKKIYFYNLPSKCEITIYTLAGDIVKQIYHDVHSNSSEIRWFENYASDGDQKFAGGEHAWDLITDHDQAIATGLYLFTVKNLETDDIKKGKFLVIK